MPVCPACEAENLPDSTACRRCGLVVELFEPIRAAIGLPKGDPRYEAQVRELIEALGDLANPGATPDTLDAEIATPARFPSIAPPMGVTEPGGSSLGLRELPKPSVPPDSGDLTGLRQRIDELLRLARRTGLEEGAWAERAREVSALEDASAVQRFASEMFVRVAASLTETYTTLLARRDELTKAIPTEAIDARIADGRAALEAGDLAETERCLREVSAALDRDEEAWGPTEVLLNGAEDLVGAIRDFGGDPAAALGPIEEGRRLVRRLEREAAEALLARGTLGLWTILNPLLEQDLAHRIDEVRARKEAGADVDPVLTDLREFARLVKQRNFSAAVAFYRRGVDRLARLAPAGAASSLNIDPSVPPA